MTSQYVVLVFRLQGNKSLLAAKASTLLPLSFDENEFNFRLPFALALHLLSESVNKFIYALFGKLISPVSYHIINVGQLSWNVLCFIRQTDNDLTFFISFSPLQLGQFHFVALKF